jgi:hypothetical protein
LLDPTPFRDGRGAGRIVEAADGDGDGDLDLFFGEHL